MTSEDFVKKFLGYEGDTFNQVRIYFYYTSGLIYIHQSYIWC